MYAIWRLIANISGLEQDIVDRKTALQTAITPVSRDCPRVPPFISGTGKATNFKFCTRILSIDQNKSPLQISGKVAVGVVRDSRNFSGHPCIAAVCTVLLYCPEAHFCDSSAFLL